MVDTSPAGKAAQKRLILSCSGSRETHPSSMSPLYHEAEGPSNVRGNFHSFTMFPYTLHIMCEGSMATASFRNSAAFSFLPRPMFPRAIR